MVAIIAILAGMLLPALNKARERAKSAQCVSNLKQQGVGLLAYATANDDMLPVAHNSTRGLIWCSAIKPYVNLQQYDVADDDEQEIKRRSKIFICPVVEKVNHSFAQAVLADGTRDDTYCTYAMNGKISAHKITKIKKPSDCFLVIDGGGNQNYQFQYGNANDNIAIIYNDVDKAGAPRHNDSMNVLCVDGHVMQYSRSQMKAMTHGGAEFILRIDPFR